MSETLALPVEFNNTEHMFPMEMIRWGYTHRFKIEVQNISLFFEPDEEGIYRAIVEDGQGIGRIDAGLLKAIGDTLHILMDS